MEDTLYTVAHCLYADHIIDIEIWGSRQTNAVGAFEHFELTTRENVGIASR